MHRAFVCFVFHGTQHFSYLLKGKKERKKERKSIEILWKIGVTLQHSSIHER